jgi:hypothetical protein
VSVVASFARAASSYGVVRASVAFVGAFFVVAGAASPQANEPAPEGSPLRMEALVITPERPGSDTLCRLTVRLHNAGAKPMYAFAFDVELGGVALPVYERQLFLQAIPAGETAEVRLYNFWTTETGRSRPADGKLEVLVRVREALWLEISTEAEEAAGDGAEQPEPVEVWTPAGEVPGLPLSRTQVLELAP